MTSSTVFPESKERYEQTAIAGTDSTERASGRRRTHARSAVARNVLTSRGLGPGGGPLAVRPDRRRGQWRGSGGRQLERERRARALLADVSRSADQSEH